MTGHDSWVCQTCPDLIFFTFFSSSGSHGSPGYNYMPLPVTCIRDSGLRTPPDPSPNSGIPSKLPDPYPKLFLSTTAHAVSYIRSRSLEIPPVPLYFHNCNSFTAPNNNNCSSTEEGERLEWEMEGELELEKEWEEPICVTLEMEMYSRVDNYSDNNTSSNDREWRTIQTKPNQTEPCQ